MGLPVLEKTGKCTRSVWKCRMSKLGASRFTCSDLAAAAANQGYTETTLADKAEIAFDTVRSLLTRPSNANVRSLEKLCAALGQPLQLVV